MMETRTFQTIAQPVSRIGLGTWAIGGWMWGGTEEKQSIKTILTALDREINLIDTAPIYGFGTSEKIVGKALQEYGRRDKVILSTKAGLEWDDNEKVVRNSDPERIKYEVEQSLKRLQTDYIDIYFIHWPDPRAPFEETAAAMEDLFQAGKIRAIGVSNYSPQQMRFFRKREMIHFCQPPYNIFERGIEDDVKPYCEENEIALMTYGVLCRGLLTGKMKSTTEFKGDDLRKYDPKFQPPRYEEYLKAVDLLDQYAQKHFDKRVIDLAVRWVLDQDSDIVLWGARRPDQLDAVDNAMGWSLDLKARNDIVEIVRSAISDEVGPEFMAPPDRSRAELSKS